MKIPKFKRSKIGIIAEFRRIPNRFPNQAAQQVAVREELAAGRREEENNQLRTRFKTLGVVEHKSAQQAAAREVLGVVKRKSAQ
jgi:hypothetical protein